MPAPPPPPATSGLGQELGPAAIIAIGVASGAVFVPCVVQYWRRKMLEREEARLVAAEAWEARVREKAARELEKGKDGDKSGRESRRSKRSGSRRSSGRSSERSSELSASSGSESDSSSRRSSRRSRKSRKRELGRGESERIAQELEDAAAAAASRLALGEPAPPRMPAASPPGRDGRRPIPDTDLERGSAASSELSYASVSSDGTNRPKRWWQRERIRI